MITYIATVNISLKATEEEIRDNLDLNKDDVITEVMLATYFEEYKYDLSGSNGGSEMLANADIIDIKIK